MHLAKQSITPSFKILEIVTLAVLAAGSIPSRTAASSLALTYEDGQGNSMPYRLFLPPGHDPNEKYPLVLALHGSGSRGTDNSRQLGFAEHLITATHSRRYASFLVVPQVPWGDNWLSIRSVDLVEGILDAVQAEYQINPRRLYVTGYSMGGVGTLGQLYYFPGKYAAGVPIASGTAEAVTIPVAEVIHETPIWLFHGDQDTVVSVDNSRRLAEALEMAGSSPLYTEYPGEGHGIVHRVYAMSQLYSWMFDQQLVPEPAGFVLLPWPFLGMSSDIGSPYAQNAGR